MVSEEQEMQRTHPCRANRVCRALGGPEEGENMNPRLLTQEERILVSQALPLLTLPEKQWEAYLKAQDAKSRKIDKIRDKVEIRRATPKTVVEELDEPCPHGTLCEDTSKASKHECPICWAEFCKEAGLE